jgi:hypothetical protein
MPGIISKSQLIIAICHMQYPENYFHIAGIRSALGWKQALSPYP